MKPVEMGERCFFVNRAIEMDARRRPMPQSGKIRVGVVGANPEKGWGGAVHLPAILALPEFSLVAVGTSRAESAAASAKLFGAKLAFSDAASLVAHPDVDLVVISVKAPEHYAVAMMALEAGKHVYCEWPLAANTTQAVAMRDLAAAKGVKTMVGLQARAAPALKRARDLVHDGYVGRVAAVRLACALPGGGTRRSQEGLYVIHNRNGASTLAIQGGHAIDALRFVAGEFAGLSAVVDNQFPSVEVIETGEILAKDAPDHILASGRLQNGASVSIAINGGAVAGFGIELTIFGTAGTLSVFRNSFLNFQMSELCLAGAKPGTPMAALEIPAGYDPMLFPTDFVGRSPYPGIPLPRATLVNVANLYRGLATAIMEDTEVEPDFATGVALHEILDSLTEGSETGKYQSLAGHNT
jgi:predicted dehydrogenase